MLAFLLLSIVLGLWSSPRARKGGIVAALTLGMVLFFLFFPGKL
jgi:fucose permease